MVCGLVSRVNTSLPSRTKRRASSEFAIAEIEKLAPDLRDQAALAIVPGWFHRDGAAARNWAESVNDAELRGQLLELVESIRSPR